MDRLNNTLNTGFRWLISPSWLHRPWPALLLVSFLASLLVLAVFRVASDQRSIRRRKDRMLARLLELLLFRHDPLVSLGSLGRVLAANGAYLALTVKPLVVSLPLIVVIMAQVSLWFGARPLRPGQSILVTARLPASLPVMEQSLTLNCSTNLALAASPVRVPSENAAYWQVTASRAGPGSIGVSVNGQVSRKSVSVGEGLAPVPVVRRQGHLWNQWMNPGEAPLPAGNSVREISLDYPEGVLRLARKPVNETAAFLVLTLAFAWAMKKPFGVVV